MEKGVSGIYKITNPKGRVYIGQSKCIKSRWRFYTNGYEINQPILKNSLLKHGPGNHIFEIIEECSPEELNKRERYWQEFYDVLDREKGLNCNLTETDSQAKVMSVETREKMSKAKEGIYFGENNPFFGKTHTVETRKRMSEANFEFLKNNPHSALGRKVSEEERRTSSERMKGKYVGSKNPMYGVPSPMTGKKHSEEARKKMSERLKGRNLGVPLKESTIQKLREIRKGEGNPRAKPVINLETGIFYGCIKDAAIAYGIPIKRLQENLRNKNFYKCIAICE